MAKIEVVFDPQIKNPEIEIPLTNPHSDESPDPKETNKMEMAQTRVHGILAPLIRINNINIDIIDIIEFSLKCVNAIPTLSLTVLDKYGFIGAFDYPGTDNEIYVQILPAFEGAYKKMDMCFYITQVKTKANYISLTCVYKLQKFTDTNIKALGQMNTYDLCEFIAKETKLGFAANISTNDVDKRYIYCDNKSYKDLLEREIKFSGSDQMIYDYWIDFWNYFNLIDIKERYTTTVGPDKEDEMRMYVSGQHYEYEISSKSDPVIAPKILTNHPSFMNKENYIKEYNTITKSSKQISKGVDRIYSIYNEDMLEYSDNVVSDGDVEKDIFRKMEYVGENYGEYNYMFMNKCRDAFFQKMNNESLEIITPQPTFGICRGQKVLFHWYQDNRNNIYNKMDHLKNENVIDPNPKTQIELANDSLKSTEGELRLDKYISGEYLVTKIVLEFRDGKWFNKLTLNRPDSEKTKLLLID